MSPPTDARSSSSPRKPAPHGPACGPQEVTLTRVPAVEERPVAECVTVLQAVDITQFGARTIRRRMADGTLRTRMHGRRRSIYLDSLARMVGATYDTADV